MSSLKGISPDHFGIINKQFLKQFNPQALAEMESVLDQTNPEKDKALDVLFVRDAVFSAAKTIENDGIPVFEEVDKILVTLPKSKGIEVSETFEYNLVFRNDSEREQGVSQDSKTNHFLSRFPDQWKEYQANVIQNQVIPIEHFEAHGLQAVRTFKALNINTAQELVLFADSRPDLIEKVQHGGSVVSAARLALRKDEEHAIVSKKETKAADKEAQLANLLNSSSASVKTTKK